MSCSVKRQCSWTKNDAGPPNRQSVEQKITKIRGIIQRQTSSNLHKKYLVGTYIGTNSKKYPKYMCVFTWHAFVSFALRKQNNFFLQHSLKQYECQPLNNSHLLINVSFTRILTLSTTTTTLQQQIYTIPQVAVVERLLLHCNIQCHNTKMSSESFSCRNSVINM